MPSIVAAALACVPSSAHALTVFGSDLNRPANNGVDCTAVPTSILGAFAVFPSNQQTCTWVATGRDLGARESFAVPSGNGTIVRVRVKVGAISGPMQVVVLRAIRPAQGPVQIPTGGGAGVNVACCKEVARSAPFTPAPNAVSTIAMNLPVKSDVVPNPITLAYDFDVLGLSVLAPGVPVPAHDTGEWANINNLNASFTAGYYPAWQPGQERVDSSGIMGYQVLMQADWEPEAAATPVAGTVGATPVAGTVGATPGAAVTLVAPTARVRQNFLSFGLRCNQATPCTGAVVVQNRNARVANAAALRALAARERATAGPAAKKSRLLTLAKGKFSIKAGKAKTITARFTRQGRRYVRRYKKRLQRVVLYANLKVGKKQIRGGRLHLKR